MMDQEARQKYETNIELRKLKHDVEAAGWIVNGGLVGAGRGGGGWGYLIKPDENLPQRHITDQHGWKMAKIDWDDGNWR